MNAKRIDSSKWEYSPIFDGFNGEAPTREGWYIASFNLRDVQEVHKTKTAELHDAGSTMKWYWKDGYWYVSNSAHNVRACYQERHWFGITPVENSK